MANSLIVNLIGNTASFQTDMKRAEGNVRSLQSTVNNMGATTRASMAGGTASSRQMVAGFQALGYAVQDASSQIGTRGLAGALNAVSNNVPGVLMLLGPKMAGWGILGSVVVAVSAAYLQMAGSAEKASEANERLDKTLEGIRKRLQEQAEFEHELKRMRSQEESTRQIESLDKEVSSRQAAIKETERQIAAEEKRISLLEQETNSFRDSQGLSMVPFGTSIAGLIVGPSSADKKRLKELREEAVKIRDELTVLELKKSDIKLATPEIKKREEEDKAIKKVVESTENAKEEAKRYYQDTRTAAERYQAELEKIEKLKSKTPGDGLLDEESARRAAERAYKTMQNELNKGLSATVNLTPAMDANSANAMTGFNTALQNSYVKNQTEIYGKVAPMPDGQFSKKDGEDVVRSIIEKWNRTGEQQLEVQKKTAAGIEQISKKKDMPIAVFNF